MQEKSIVAEDFECYFFNQLLYCNVFEYMYIWPALYKEIFIFSFNSVCHIMTSRWRTCEKVSAAKVDENITRGTKYRKM